MNIHVYIHSTHLLVHLPNDISPWDPSADGIDPGCHAGPEALPWQQSLAPGLEQPDGSTFTLW